MENIDGDKLIEFLVDYKKCLQELDELDDALDEDINNMIINIEDNIE